LSRIGIAITAECLSLESNRSAVVVEDQSERSH